MKILAFIGSPRHDGNTATLVSTICREAENNGHEAELYYLYEMDNQGCKACNACQNKQVEFCAIQDSMTAVLAKIAAADCLIIGTPVYVGQVSGGAKHFIDRLRPFLQPDHTVKCLPGKKYITVTCSGAPAQAFKGVTDYLNQWLGGFFKMENAGAIIAGGLRPPDAVLQQPDLLQQAEQIGRQLA